MRDRGKTLVFSTHQLDQAEELCDSVAIIDHGTARDDGPDARRQALDRPPGRPRRDRRPTATSRGSDRCRTSRVTRPGRDFTELHVDAGTDPQAVLRAAIGRATTSSASRSPIRRSRRSSSSASERSTSRSSTLAAGGGAVMSTIVAHRRRRAARVQRPGPNAELPVRDGPPAPRRRRRSLSLPVIVQYIDRSATQRGRRLRRARPTSRGDPAADARGPAQRLDRPRDRAGRHRRPDSSVTDGARPCGGAIGRDCGPIRAPSSRSSGRPSGDLAFTLYTNDHATGPHRRSSSSRHATSIAVADRLSPPRHRAQPIRPALFAPDRLRGRVARPGADGPTPRHGRDGSAGPARRSG